MELGWSHLDYSLEVIAVGLELGKILWVLTSQPVVVPLRLLPGAPVGPRKSEMATSLEHLLIFCFYFVFVVPVLQFWVLVIWVLTQSQDFKHEYSKRPDITPDSCQKICYFVLTLTC